MRLHFKQGVLVCCPLEQLSTHLLKEKRKNNMKGFSACIVCVLELYTNAERKACYEEVISQVNFTTRLQSPFLAQNNYYIKLLRLIHL